jgi:hypothetical protein
VADAPDPLAAELADIRDRAAQQSESQRRYDVLRDARYTGPIDKYGYARSGDTAADFVLNRKADRELLSKEADHG